MNSSITNSSITKFSIDNATEIKEYYDSQGYVVINNILDHSTIDEFIYQYEKIKWSNFFVFQSQSIHRPSKPKLTPEGFIKESMENATDLKLFPGFSKAIINCLTTENISTVLSILSGASNHTMWQNMFFDKSTGTVEHQDHYYLDTNPAGHLIGAWYSLENINPEAGCFFVLPGSHKGQIIEREEIVSSKKGIEGYFADHEKMRQNISNLIRDNSYEYKALPLNKGDVLFWHPGTIHGAYKNENPQFSRKSFTAHFYPSHLARADGRTLKLKQSTNPKIAVKGNEVKLYAKNIQLYFTYLLNQITRQEPLMNMRRDSY